MAIDLGGKWQMTAKYNAPWWNIHVERPEGSVPKKRKLKTGAGRWVTTNVGRHHFYLAWDGKRFADGSELAAIKKNPALFSKVERIVKGLRKAA